MGRRNIKRMGASLGIGLVAIIAVGCAANPGGSAVVEPTVAAVDPATAEQVRAAVAERYDRQAAAGRMAIETENQRQEAARLAAEQAAADEARAEADRQAALAAAEQADRDAEQAAAEESEPDLYDTGWYDERGWVSPASAQRAKEAGIPAGGTVPNYLRCGTICGESPTSGEVQQQWLEEQGLTDPDGGPVDDPCGFQIRGTCYPSAEAAQAAGEGE